MSAALILAGRWRRLWAALIDLVLVFLIGLVLMVISGVMEDAEDYGSDLVFLWIPLLGIASYLILNGRLLWQRGQTIGKWVLGIRTVLTVSGETVSLPRLGVRALFFLAIYVVFTPIGLLVILDHLMIFSGKRRCLHDYVCATSVVRIPGTS